MLNGDPVKYTSQEMNNSSFDETTGLNAVEIVGADGLVKNPATEATQQEIASALYALSQILSLLADPMFLDPSTSRVRVALESAAVTLTTVTTVSTVTSVTNLAGFNAKDTILNATEDLVWANLIRNNIT